MVFANRFYYFHLNRYEKKIYRKFERNKWRMKNGKARIEFSYAFSWLLKWRSGSDKINDYYSEATRAYLYDNPDVFYIDQNKMYINTLARHKGVRKRTKTYMDAGANGNYYVHGYKSRLQISIIERKLRKIVRGLKKVTRGMSDYDKVKTVHDYLVNTCRYDIEFSNPNMFNIYGALIDGVCVCAGYARALKYVLDSMGIKCICIIGRGGDILERPEGHAWNYVKLEGEWYAIDVTWDDPVGDVDQIRYDYFLMGSKQITKDHLPSETYDYPELAGDGRDKVCYKL